MSQKGFTPVIIVLIMILVGVLGIFVYKNNLINLGQPTTPQEESWIDYNNDNLSLKHPANLNIGEKIQMDGESVVGIRISGPKGLFLHLDNPTGIAPAKTTKEAAELSRTNKMIKYKDTVVSDVKQTNINGFSGDFYDFEDGVFVGTSIFDGVALSCSKNRAIFINNNQGVAIVLFCLEEPYLKIVSSLTFK